MLTQRELRACLDYDQDVGQFTWRIGRGTGRVAGCKDDKGYVVIKIGGKVYKAHRLAFLHVEGAWPSADVDHRDLDPSNNRWSNLRDVSRLQNNVNIRSAAGSVSEYLGVYMVPKRRKKWAARIRTSTGRKFLGYFDREVDAAKAYHSAAIAEHGEFARGNPGAFTTEEK